MALTVIILFILASLSFVIMDELRFHFARVFGKIIPEKYYSWWNPVISWENKYHFNNNFLRFIFSTVLVWTTDAWHFFKFISLSSLFLIILLFENKGLSWWQYLIELGVVHLCFGFISETFWWLLSWIGDRLSMSDKKHNSNDGRKKGTGNNSCMATIGDS